MGNMRFRDLSTKDLDLIIQYKPDYNFPTKDISTEHVLGRNGDLYIDNKSWQNVERTYSIVSVFRPGTDFVSNCEKLIKWLTQESGYFRLEDDYDPHVYRIAAFKGNGSLPNLYDQATVLNVTFDCKPQRYLKSGEKEIEFNSSIALIENPTGYSALPDIKIDGITNPASDDVLLLTVGTTKDEVNFDNVSSIITLSNIPQDVTSIILESETQTCYSNQNGNINSSINLNDKQFPSLDYGMSMISVKKYKENSSYIESYNSKLTNSQLICYTKYMPYKTQVETKQKITVVKSWNLLKQQVEEVYSAGAYSAYCMEKAETYTFDSYNKLLENNCVAYTVNMDDLSDLPSWLTIEGTTLKVGNISSITDWPQQYLQDKAYFYINNKGNIILKSQGDTLVTGLTESSSVQIILYPAKLVDNKYELAVDYDYTDNDWCKLQVNYEQSNHVTVESISFITCKVGFFYLPKSGLFGKAQWKKIDTIGTVLNTLSWRSYSKAFVPNGISVSKTATFTYYFLPYPYKVHEEGGNIIVDEYYLQYEPIKDYKRDSDGNIIVDGNGNKETEIVNDVTFIVTPDNNIEKIRIDAKYNGNYRIDYTKHETKLDEFDHYYNNGSQAIELSFNATSTFNMYCIRDDGENQNPVSYESVDNWPSDLIDPHPVNPDAPGVPMHINPPKIDYKVLKRGWYRTTYIEDDETKYTPWKLLEANELLITGIPINTEGGQWPAGFNYNKADVNCSIYFIEPNEDDNFPVTNYAYEFDPINHKSVPDIAFFDKDGNLYTNNQPPSWLKVEVVQGSKEDYTDVTLVFKVGDSSPNTSLYKWDAKSNYTSKDKISEGHLTDSSRTDDTTVYYLSSLPVYSGSELHNKYTAIINQNEVTGDPETVSFFPINNGYYRPKNNTYWKWQTSSDEICNSKNSETTTIYDLTESNDQTNKITITITPRWWSL